MPNDPTDREFRLDVAAIARERGTFELKLPIAELPRLAGTLSSDACELAVQVTGDTTRRREPPITCIIRGSVVTDCQRCLEPLQQRIDIRSQLVFVADETRLPAVEDEEPEVDYLVLEAALDLRELVQDEVILALPVAPAHAPGACQAPASGVGTESRSAFATL